MWVPSLVSLQQQSLALGCNNNGAQTITLFFCVSAPTDPFHWAWLPMAKTPFSERTKEAVLPLLSDSNFISSLVRDLYELFKVSKGFLHFSNDYFPCAQAEMKFLLANKLLVQIINIKTINCIVRLVIRIIGLTYDSTPILSSSLLSHDENN